ncbi:MAG: hypothetical protein CMM67_08185 [Rhodospirillaceae bacterium]|nr:hypothetical protein [Rhodospirillaceae bacterium]OUT77199.1 MAG: hypothetical protein CBB83_08360 [Rhodospirillaceae bacterium TMED23]|tara:strand:+ start:27 stop:1157 length:1131 start_codon:yes stop_codon:yes gene_type:complete
MKNSEYNQSLSDKSVGQILHDARLRLNENISEVSRTLKIRQVYLEALESNNFDQLPGKIYVIGFIKAYAKYLELDVEEIINLHKSANVTEISKSDLVFPTIVPEDGMPSKAIIVFGLIIVILVYGGWHYYNNNTFTENKRTLNKSEVSKLNQVKNLRKIKSNEITKTPKDNETTDDSSKKLKIAKNTDQKTSIEIGLGAKVPKILLNKQIVSDKYNKDVDSKPTLQNTKKEPNLANGIKTYLKEPKENKISSLDNKTKVDDKSISQKPKVKSENNISSAETKVKKPSRIKIRALSDSYLQIRNRSLNQILTTRLLKKGSTYEVPDQDGLSLITGNAGALEIFVDGQKAPPLGAIGSVRRNVLLVPKDLIAGTSRGE